MRHYAAVERLHALAADIEVFAAQLVQRVTAFALWRLAEQLVGYFLADVVRHVLLGRARLAHHLVALLVPRHKVAAAPGDVADLLA